MVSICEYLPGSGSTFVPAHIVHAGAHHGQEACAYDAAGAGRVTWIEADPDAFWILNERMKREARWRSAEHRCIQALLFDRDGGTLPFHRYSNLGHSSSVYEALPRQAEHWPGVGPTGEVLDLPAATLDRVLEEAYPQGACVDTLVLDLQGAELACLKGAVRTLASIRFLQLEVSCEPFYAGGALFGELETHLSALGFVRRTGAPLHGDVIYERPGLARSGRRHAHAAARAARRAPDRRAAYDITLLLRDAQQCACEIERREAMAFADLLAAQDVRSPAQNAQDLWVVHRLRGRTDGFFVDVGAFDGHWLSNTALLEDRFGWRGICAEPSPAFGALRHKRNCRTDPRCVWRASGERMALCVPEALQLSTLRAFKSGDLHAGAREAALEIDVETVSLNDLLEQHEAPERIDFMSIDTEGSEFDILECFDFGSYAVTCMAVEHNRTENEARLDALLSARGFRRVMRNFSRFDAWYVNTAS